MATLSAEEKQKHSVIYDESTSEIKDDIVSLLACFKTNSGPLNRQSAAFLLWYHAMSGGKALDDMLSNNGVSVCLGILDSDESTPVDKSCAAGILNGMCLAEENREAIISGKASGNSANAVLHAQLADGDSSLLYAARTLRNVAEDAAGRAVMLKLMEQKLQYSDIYLDLFYKSKESVCVAHVCGMLAALLNGRPDLVDDAIEKGLVEALLHVARKHKAPQTVCMAMSCLYKLMEDRASWRRVIEADGLQLLVDVLGPPPQGILEHEMIHHRSLVDPLYAAELRRAAVDAAEEARASSAGGDGTARATGRPEKPNTSKSATESLSKAGESDVDVRSLLSLNSCGLKWHQPNEEFALATSAAAAGCLYEMVTNTDNMHEMSRRLMASRLVPLLKAAMGSVDVKGKKAKRKKKLVLSPEQIEAATRIVGCLKFLTMVNTNRYRVAQLGAARCLISLYEECANTLLRRNAQTTLSNIAMLAENGQVLLESKLPEEFLVSVPIRLSSEETDQLVLEFPDSGLRESFQKLSQERSDAAFAEREPEF